MKAQIKAGENVRSTVGRMVGEGIYVSAHGFGIPEDFVILCTNRDRSQFGVKPMQDYQEARDLVKKLNAQEEK